MKQRRKRPPSSNPAPVANTAAGDLPVWAADFMATLPPFVAHSQAAELLGCGPRTIARRVARGQLMSIAPCGTPLIPRRSLVDFVVASAGAA